MSTLRVCISSLVHFLSTISICLELSRDIQPNEYPLLVTYYILNIDSLAIDSLWVWTHSGFRHVVADLAQTRQVIHHLPKLCPPFWIQCPYHAWTYLYIKKKKNRTVQSYDFWKHLFKLRIIDAWNNYPCWLVAVRMLVSSKTSYFLRFIQTTSDVPTYSFFFMTLLTFTFLFFCVSFCALLAYMGVFLYLIYMSAFYSPHSTFFDELQWTLALYTIKSWPREETSSIHLAENKVLVNRKTDKIINLFCKMALLSLKEGFWYKLHTLYPIQALDI